MITHRIIVNIYVSYKKTDSSSNTNGSTLKVSFFGAVKLTKTSDIDKYQYSGYGIGFGREGSFSLPLG